MLHGCSDCNRARGLPARRFHRLKHHLSRRKCKNFSKLFVGTAHVTRDEMLKNMLQEGKGRPAERIKLQDEIYAKQSQLGKWQQEPDCLVAKVDGPG